MKCCVYTCITGGYDSLKEIPYKNDALDYLCFTNNRSLMSETWKIVYVDEDLDNQLLQRKIKILCHKYLSDYDTSLYMDGKVLIRKDVLGFIERNLKDDVELVGFKHPERDCIYEEIYFCILFGKETLSSGMRIYDMYRSEGYPDHFGLSETAILLRRHTDNVAALMEFWYYRLETYSRRDQLSFFYCLWKKPVKSVFLDDNIYENEFFATDYWHRPQSPCGPKTCLADFNPEGSYDPTLLVESTYISGLPDTVEAIMEFVVPAQSNSFRIRMDELGNWLLGVSTDPDLKVELYYGIHLDKQFLFLNYHALKITGNMEKGRTVQVKVRIKELSKYDLTDCLIKCATQRLEGIERLKTKENELADTQNLLTSKVNELADTRNLLTAKENELVDTQNLLTSKENELVDTRNLMSDMEKRLSDTKKQLADSELRLANAEHLNAEILSTRSFKIGRALTWLPRKVRGLVRHWREHRKR